MGEVKGLNSAPWILSILAFTMACVAWNVRTRSLQNFDHHVLSVNNFTYSSPGDHGIFQITLPKRTQGATFPLYQNATFPNNKW